MVVNQIVSDKIDTPNISKKFETFWK